MKYLLLLATALFSTSAHADLSVGLSKKYALAVYDVSLNGGQSTSHDLNATIPSGSTITDVFVYINKAFTDGGGSSSVGFQCVGTNDLMGWNDLTVVSKNSIIGRQLTPTVFANAGSLIIENATGTAVSLATLGTGTVPSACQVKAVVRSSSGYVPLTAGKASLVIEYFNQSFD